jgi:hypothetical protein
MPHMVNLGAGDRRPSARDDHPPTAGPRAADDGRAFAASASAFELDDPAFEARTLRSFIRRDRLVSIPARERRKRVILRFLRDQVLPDDEPVSERDLNERLARWNPDFASLRRYLVDTGLATRDGMTYRRGRPPG